MPFMGPNGVRGGKVTVSELKDIINNWPELTENGDPAEVWIETGLMLSSMVTDSHRLGRGDILLLSNAFEEHR
jgi:hypothetical protein